MSVLSHPSTAAAPLRAAEIADAEDLARPHVDVRDDGDDHGRHLRMVRR